MNDREAGVPSAPSTPDLPPRAPVGRAERIASLDFIRGVAVLGILFANITAFGQPTVAYSWPPALGAGATGANAAFWLVQFVFVDAKFRILFTLLFGAGLYIFMERAWSRGEGRGLQVRRLLVLLLFGLLHYYLIWIGDILSLYAFWGLVALMAIGWKARTQLRAGLFLVVIKALMVTAVMTIHYRAESPAIANPVASGQAAPASQLARELLAEARDEIAVYRGSYGDILAKRLDKPVQTLRKLLMGRAVETIGLILVGMALYRQGLFSGGIDAGRLRRWGWGLLVPGLLLAAAVGYGPWATGFDPARTMAVVNGLGDIPHLMTAFGLLFLLVALSPRAVPSRLGGRFAAAGRMAFSNYLGTSLLMMPLFHGWGLGLYGRLDRVGLMAIVLGVWTLMLLWSKPWLDRFRYGPLEWLWRCLTYGRRFPIRRAA